MVDFAASFVCGVLSVVSSVCGVLSVTVTLPTLASAQNLLQRRHSPTLSAITSFDPVSDSTPTAFVTEIDGDSALTEAQDNLRVLLSQGKRHSVEAQSVRRGTLDARVAMLLECVWRMTSATFVKHRHRSWAVQDTRREMSRRTCSTN